MSIIKRIFASIVRKPIKSILLVLTVFVLGSFVGSSYSIYQATKNVNQTIKSNIDTFASLQFNWDKENNNRELDNSMKELLYIYSQLKEKDSVVESNINPISDIFTFESNISHPRSNIFIPFFVNYVSLTGTNPNENLLITDSKQNSADYLYQISEGRMFTEKDWEQKKKYVILDEECKYLDGSIINIGDQLPATFYAIEDEENIYDLDVALKETLPKKTYKFEVIGKARINPVFSGNANLYENGVLGSSFIILDNVMSDLIAEINDFNYMTYQIPDFVKIKNLNTFFKLDSIDNMNDFVYYYHSLNSNNDDIKLITSADGYLEIKGTLKSMNIMAMTILIIAVMASLLVGVMMIYLFLKERKKEVGILLAMGETKKHILATICSEIVILGLVGLCFSIIGGNSIGNKIAEDMLQKQLNKTTVEQLKDANYQKEIKEQMAIKMDVSYVVIMLTGGALVLAFSSAYPIVSVMRLKPKDILLHGGLK